MAQNSIETICLDDDDDDDDFVESNKKPRLGCQISHASPTITGAPFFNSNDSSVTPRISRKEAERIKVEVNKMFTKNRIARDNSVNSPLSDTKAHQRSENCRKDITRTVRKNLLTEFKEMQELSQASYLAELCREMSEEEFSASQNKVASVSTLANENIPSSPVNVEVATVQINLDVIKPGHVSTQQIKSPDSLKNSCHQIRNCSPDDVPSSNSESPKLSYCVKKHPNKFCLPSQKQVSPVKSPSPRKKNNTFLNIRQTLSKNKAQQKKKTVRKALNLMYTPRLTQSSTNVTENVNKIQQCMLVEAGYHARYFTTLINEVIENEKTKMLINQEEMDIINSFLKLENKAKELFVRIYYRKFRWLKVADLRYELDFDRCIKELEDHGFFTTDVNDASLEELFDLLKKKDIETLAKSLNIKCTGMNKGRIWLEIKKYSTSQTHISENLQIISSEKFLKGRIKELAGNCLKLCLIPRGLFHRVELLFSMMFTKNEDLGSDSVNLLNLCYVGTNKIFYPSYTVDTTSPIFASRDDLLKYEEAASVDGDVTEAIQQKDWPGVREILTSVRNSLMPLITNTGARSALKLPLCLRYFTPGTAYVNALSKGIDALKKLGEADQAIADLRMLLSQTVYLPYHRGQWYEKLAVILSTKHSFEELSDTLVQGLSDEWTDEVHKHMLSHRCKNLLKTKKASKLVKTKVKNYVLPDLRTAPIHVIKAKALDETKSGYKKVYVQIDAESKERTYSSVEEVAKSYYKKQGYLKGSHAEGGLIYSIFALLFWNIIYESQVTHVFQSPYQKKPLDLDSGEFYENRENEIQRRLSEMEKWTEQEVHSWVTKIYEDHVGEMSLVNWAWFPKVEDALEIIFCINWNTLLKICEKIAKTYKTSHSGFPDLMLWTPGKKLYKFVEVKGPNDKLSMSQKLWLDFLVGIGANAEVCFVTTVGSLSWEGGETSRKEAME